MRYCCVVKINLNVNYKYNMCITNVCVTGYVYNGFIKLMYVYNG